MISEIKKKLSLLLVFVFLAALLPTAANANTQAEPEIPYFDLPCAITAIKVGLYSGSAALYGVELENPNGEGYDIGYYDFSRQFRKIAETDHCAVSIAPVSSERCYVLLEKNFESYAAAAAAASDADGLPVYSNRRFKVATAAYESEAEAKAALVSGTELLKAGNNTSLITSGDKAIFLFDSANISLALKPIGVNGEGEARLRDDIYRGGIELLRTSSGAYTVINYVGIEDYVKGVLPYEVGGNWPLDSLKAQAACARTYAINNVNAYIDDGFDVRADTYSQVYHGVSGTTESTNIAADETAGKFVRYEGVICRVYYMSSDGGATESGANVFGERREYLTGVEDSYELAEDYYNKSWSETKSEAALLSRLNRFGYELSDIESITPVLSESGNVIAIEFASSGGETVTVDKTDCYMVPGLNSIRFNVEKLDAAFKFSGSGWGHNCGMSQWGAYSMAANFGFDCNAIIDFYFSGAYIG